DDIVSDEQLEGTNRHRLIIRQADGNEQQHARERRRKLGALLLRLREERGNGCRQRGPSSRVKRSSRCPGLVNSATAKSTLSGGTSAGPVRYRSRTAAACAPLAASRDGATIARPNAGSRPASAARRSLRPTSGRPRRFEASQSL